MPIVPTRPFDSDVDFWVDSRSESSQNLMDSEMPTVITTSIVLGPYGPS